MEKQKSIKDIIVVLELTEEPTSPVFPIPGSDGNAVGLMTFCHKRNRHCLRMSLEQFRTHRVSLFSARRRFFHLIPDIEFIYEDDMENQNASLDDPELNTTSKRGRPRKSVETK
jgi:hypothetical protein